MNSKRLCLIHMIVMLVVCLSEFQGVASNSCPLPLYYEFTDDFSLPTQDVHKAIANQLSNVSIASFTATNGIKIYDIVFSTQYDGSSRTVNGSGIYANITNDSFKLAASMKANVSKLPFGHDTFKVIFTINAVKVDYSKKLQQGRQNPVISNTKVIVDKSTMKVTYDPPGSKTEQKKLNQSVIAQTGITFETQLEAQLNRLQSYMNDNCKQETLSKLFPNSTYQYKNRDDIIKFDMSTQKFEYSDQKVLMNGLTGTVVNLDNNECFQTDSLDRPENAHTFISFQFIKNMIKQAFKTYGQFQDVLISKDTIRTQYLQFRLMDLEYVVPQVLNKYRKYYETQIAFSCKAMKLGDFHLDESQKNSFQFVDWHCEGYFYDQNQAKKTVINLDVTIKHLLFIRLVTYYFSVYSDVLLIESVNFNPVDDLIVTNPKLAQVLMKDTFNDLRVYTVGSYFQFMPDTAMLKYDDKGIWLIKGDKSISPKLSLES